MTKISMVCPTHGRCPDYQHLLEECIESFTRQKLGPDQQAELVILNDCPRQVLLCKTPNVRIINLPVRIPTLGQKYNAMIEMAIGDIILPTEDDDISLPNRICQAVEALTGKENTATATPQLAYDYFNPQVSWYMQGLGDKAVLHHDHTHGIVHNASAYTRKAWRLAGGYPAVSGPQDAYMDGALKRRPASVAPQLWVSQPKDWTYIYRWSVSANHLSGFTNPAAAYQNEGQRPITPGVFELKPGWLADYDELVKKTLATLD